MTIANFSPYKIVKVSIALLKPNEKIVVSGRFGIDSNRKTLSSIGKELKLSRERVRQIEKEGLKKLSANILEKNSETINLIVKSFEKNGGVAANHKISQKFLNEAISGDANEFNSLALIFFIMPQLKKIKKTKELEESWILAKLSKDDAVGIINDWVNHLEKTKKPENLEILVNLHENHKKYEMTFLSELPTISKKVINTEDGKIGLANWSEINPKNIRDKIYYVLKKNNKPLHFETITETIKKQGFDSKNVVKATVHNELIADDRFVLVGRGIYALKEWGYENGTVADVIKEVLAGKKEGLVADEIVKEVLKRRVVKRNTILINLKTKKDFRRISGNKFALV